MQAIDLRARFDFLVKDIARLNAVRFDRVAHVYDARRLPPASEA